MRPPLGGVYVLSLVMDNSGFLSHLVVTDVFTKSYKQYLYWLQVSELVIM